MAIVVGYSPSGQGRAALDAGVHYARRTGAPLVVASHQYIDADGGASAATEDAVRSELAELGAEGVEIIVRRSPTQDIGEFLLTVVSDTAARLLIIGLRRKSPIGKLNLGASARRVVLGAPCPVLAVKDEAQLAAVPRR